MKGVLGIPFIAFAPFVGVAIGVYLFGKISMAHFNPAVTLGFLITRHIIKTHLVYYLIAEIIGALLGSVFIKCMIGSNAASLGANANMIIIVNRRILDIIKAHKSHKEYNSYLFMVLAHESIFIVLGLLLTVTVIIM
jgi:glycerol uptake facilitator-like aquaporin